MKNRVEFIDFMKGFAILTIVLFHYIQPEVKGYLAKAIMIGGSGVHLFFIASGFGLALSIKPYSVMSFYRRRFPAFLAPYYIVILLSYLLNQFHPFFTNQGLYALGGHIFLYKMFDESIEGSFGYPFWFISTIIQFYLIFPLLQRLLACVGNVKFIIITLSISVLYWILLVNLDLDRMRIYNSFFLQYLWEFCLGMVLAKHYLVNNDSFWLKPAFQLLLYAVIGISLMALMVLFGGRTGKTLNDIPASLGYLSLCCLIYNLTNKWFCILKKAILWIGKISYELYLCHILMLIIIKYFLIIIQAPGPMLFYNLIIIFPIALLVANYFLKFNRKFIYKYLKS